MYYWLLSFFIGGLLFAGLFPEAQTQQQIDDENCQREAMFFLNKAAEWQHSDHTQPVSTGPAEIPLHFERREKQHYLWTTEKPGLAGCLMKVSEHSRLFYILRDHRLYDMDGTAENIEIPDDITDGSILYYYQE
ncbi:hypothetical protein [Tatumella terrea]|uniref:Uncharacterized protein n=1 Tax=Tatumella terrea TaxID=419007 RepID=A0ABW1VWH2_9GAMM